VPFSLQGHALRDREYDACEVVQKPGLDPDRGGGPKVFKLAGAEADIVASTRTWRRSCDAEFRAIASGANAQ